MKNAAVRILASMLTLCLASPAQQEPPAPSIRVSTHYVLVDAVVTDKAGKPITDLKPGEFKIKENGKEQKLASFSLERSGAAVQAEQLPPDLYSNRPEYRMPQGPLTIVLLDALNTTVQNQQLARRALLSYLGTQFKSGQQMAVFGLTNRLIRLQDFTSDPNVLIAALQRFTPQAVATGAQSPNSGPPSSLGATMQSVNGSGSGGASLKMQSAIASLNHFEADQIAGSIEQRLSETLQAMREIARITGGHSGRKNLIWVSAGFPIAFSPDEGATVTSSMADRGPITDSNYAPPTANEAYANPANQIQQQFLEEIHRTSAMMAQVQTAIYPVDARGLFNTSLVDASRSGLNESGILMTGADYGRHVSGSLGGITNSNENLREIARQTGGRAMISRNDLDNAIAIAANDGGTYYDLGYASSNKKFDGGYRSIKVEVTRPGLVVRNRAGYFAMDPEGKRGKQQDQETTAAVRSINYDSSMVQFDALVQSATAKNGKANVPIRFRIEPKTITIGEGDKKQVNVDLFILAIAADGKIAINTGKTVASPLTAEQYAQVQQKGLLVPADIELPPGRYQVRLAVRDNPSGLLGTLTAPVTVDGK